MAFTAQGDPIKFELHSTDAHSGVALTVYPSGNATAKALTVNDIVTVTDIINIDTAGGAYEILFYPISTGVIAHVDGLVIARGNAEVKGGLAHHFETPVTGPKGYGVAVIADAGVVDLVLTGNVTKA